MLMIANKYLIGKLIHSDYNNNMTKNAYIHIPFCTKKCNYCSFISFPTIEYLDSYVNALCLEIKNHYKEEILSTIYFGGGTPSILPAETIYKILNLFKKNTSTEITLEINPEKIDKNYIKNIKDFGINRISIGCQTFDNKILSIIGRRHIGDDVVKTVELLQEYDFNNISLDFIYGLPNQTMNIFLDDLKKAIDLNVQHISLYGLKIDEGCYFYKHPPKNLPDGDTQADMYLSAIELLENNNFSHYEISNFSKKGFESKHNLNYWDNNSYYGFGVSAHGYTDNTRYSNTNNLTEYIHNPLEHNNFHNLSKQEQLEEEIFLGFRKLSGINKLNIEQKYNISFDEKYKKILDKYIKSKHLLRTEKGYKLSKEGILVSNYILADFLD